MIFELDWHGIFAPSVPFLEIVLRGTVVYLALFVLLRLSFKRIGGSIGLGDVLMIALVAAAEVRMEGDDSITVIPREQN